MLFPPGISSMAFQILNHPLQIFPLCLRFGNHFNPLLDNNTYLFDILHPADINVSQFFVKGDESRGPIRWPPSTLRRHLRSPPFPYRGSLTDSVASHPLDCLIVNFLRSPLISHTLFGSVVNRKVDFHDLVFGFPTTWRSSTLEGPFSGRFSF